MDSVSAVVEGNTTAAENSAAVEEVTASARALSEMAQALQSLVAQFKLSEDAPTSHRPAAVGGQPAVTTYVADRRASVKGRVATPLRGA